MSNWEEAHRIKTNALKSALMFLSQKMKPKSKYLTLHPRKKKLPRIESAIKQVTKFLA